MAGTAVPATGIGWNTDIPDNAQAHGNDYNEHRETKKALDIRIKKEHVAFAADSVGGEHKAGSAVAYYQAAAPTKKPDAATDLDSDDAGRLFVDSDDNMLSVYSGSAWAAIGIPVGTVSPFAGSSAPSGWLLCDGSAVSRTTYAKLFAVCSTAYGTGDGSSTFNLPNLKGKVPVGKDAAQTEFDTLGETGGEKTHLLTSAESGLPAHTHGFDVYTASDSQNSNLVGAGVTTDRGNATTGANAAANAASAHNNLQPYQVLNYIIKY
jgi:microcystin-dependent protein